MWAITCNYQFKMSILVLLSIGITTLIGANICEFRKSTLRGWTSCQGNGPITNTASTNKKNRKQIQKSS
jgi:hypothetical protein